MIIHEFPVDYGEIHEIDRTENKSHINSLDYWKIENNLTVSDYEIF